MQRTITYLRVSTKRQGASGLGLEAQKKMIDDYLLGKQVELLGQFVEVESGKNNNRPQLGAAILQCRMTGSTLVIAKLDRLARNVQFTATLMESGVDFVACDMPQASKFTIHILAAVAEQEAEAISQRTKAALAAAKARGRLLGIRTDNLTPEHACNGRRIGAAAVRNKADEFAKRIYPIIEAYQQLGEYTLSGIANRLNDANILTPRQKRGCWTAEAVKNIIKRVAEKT